MKNNQIINDEIYLKAKPKIDFDGKSDYSYCTDIHLFITSGFDSQLIRKDNILGDKIVKTTIQEIKDNYISITDFFKTAEYVGRAAYRKEPITYPGGWDGLQLCTY